MKKFVSLVLALCILLGLCSCSARNEDLQYFIKLAGKKTYTEETIVKSKKLLGYYDICKNSKKLPTVILNKFKGYEGKLTNKRLDNSIRIMNNLTLLGFKNEEVNKEFDLLMLSKVAEYREKNDLWSCYKLMCRLGNIPYESSEIKTAYLNILENIKMNVLIYNHKAMYKRFFMVAFSDWEKCYYTEDPVLEYKEVTDFIKRTSEKAITQNARGGYYDRLQSLFDNQSYWFSPFYNKPVPYGSRGTYHVKIENAFAGDFRIYLDEKKWYESSMFYSGNEAKGMLYYKEYLCGKDYIKIQELVSALKENRTYALYCDDFTYVIFIINDESIIYYDGDIRTLNQFK